MFCSLKLVEIAARDVAERQTRVLPDELLDLAPCCSRRSPCRRACCGPRISSGCAFAVRVAVADVGDRSATASRSKILGRLASAVVVDHRGGAGRNHRHRTRVRRIAALDVQRLPRILLLVFGDAVPEARDMPLCMDVDRTPACRRCSIIVEPQRTPDRRSCCASGCRCGCSPNSDRSPCAPAR